MDNNQGTVLEVRNISKAFPGVQALADVSFSVREGEVHALLGENGAGKSTLMKIIMGQYPPTEGEILLRGESITGLPTSKILDKGVAMVYQELNNMPDMTVAENVFVGREIKKNPFFVDKKAMIDETAKLLKEFHMPFKPTVDMRELSVAQGQVIEIIKAVSRNAKVIIMDEPTSSLSSEEVQELYGTIRKLKKDGISIIYISHRLEELFEVADRVTILRDGQFVDTKEISEVDHDLLISLMVGRKLENLYPKQEAQIGDVIFEAKHLTRRGVIEDVSLNVKKGEILGVAGLVGAGRTETVRAIFGMDPLDSGEIYMEGKKLNIRSPRDAIQNKIVMASEDRKLVGLVLCRSVKENILLPNLKDVSTAYPNIRISCVIRSFLLSAHLYFS